MPKIILVDRSGELERTIAEQFGGDYSVTRVESAALGLMEIAIAYAEGGKRKAEALMRVIQEANWHTPKGKAHISEEASASREARNIVLYAFDPALVGEEGSVQEYRGFVNQALRMTGQEKTPVLEITADYRPGQEHLKIGRSGEATKQSLTELLVPKKAQDTYAR